MRTGAESMGRDNDPGGLVDMPDSQGPFWLRANIGTVFRDLHMSPSGVSFLSAPIQGEKLSMSSGSIDNFFPSRFPPTHLWVFGISYILGNLITAKINVP